MPTLILNTFMNSTLPQCTDRVGHRVLKPFTRTGGLRRPVAPDSVDLYMIRPHLPKPLSRKHPPNELLQDSKRTPTTIYIKSQMPPPPGGRGIFPENTKGNLGALTLAIRVSQANTFWAKPRKCPLPESCQLHLT